MITLDSRTLPERMEAAVLEAPGRLVVKEIPLWPLDRYGDDDLVLVEVAACGVCGSDLRYFLGENPWAQHTLGRHVDNPPNIVLGHEFAGTVAAVLSERNAPLLGKRVAPLCSKPCGTCRFCTTERENLCPHTVHVGHGQGWGRQEYYPGAYAEYVPAWGKGCFEIPGRFSFEEASMMDILAVCTHVTMQGRVRKGAPVLVLGAGPAGNGIAQVARIQGADPIVLVDRVERAVDTARRCGFEHVILAGDGATAEREARRLLGGEGAFSVFDAVGSEWSIRAGLRLLDKGGTLVNMAVHDAELRLNQTDLGGERRLVTSCNFRREEYPRTLAWLGEGRIDVKPWLDRVERSDLPSVFETLLRPDKGGRWFKAVVV